ncbi:hypothetical protein T439DRAFT_327742 [Meredithblackwellia eburnea MCA 4105]
MLLPHLFLLLTSLLSTVLSLSLPTLQANGDLTQCGNSDRYCRDTETCCLMERPPEEGDWYWSCCGYVDAVCCSASRSCCPSGMVCQGEGCARLSDVGARGAGAGSGEAGGTGALQLTLNQQLRIWLD